MKFLIIAFLCGLTVQALYAHPTKVETEVQTADENVTPSDNQVCVPNEVKMEDCNRCKCAPNGVGWFCTRKECPKEVPEPETKPVARREAECEPGTSWKEDCNDCRCTSTGLKACTRKLCPPVPQEEEKTVVKRSARECEPGKKWNDGCNDCWCNDQGLKYCTKQACEEVVLTPMEAHKQKRSADEEVKAEKECEPGKSWNDGCNDCFCTEHGFKACTLKACIVLDPKEAEGEPAKTKRSADEPAKECEPGTTFKEDCNTCFCTEKGFKACTLIRCYTVEETQDFKELLKEKEQTKTKRSAEEKECEPGTKWNDGCNDCWCGDQGFKYCTKKKCVVLPPESHVQKRSADNAEEEKPKMECEPGTNFKEDCNSCFCTPSGFKACTMMRCLSAEEMKMFEKPATEEQPKTKRSPITRKSCTPGTSFQAEDGCNTCHCNDDGLPRCTLKLCPTRQVRAVENKNNPGAPDFSCEPGTSFKHADGCNDCTCAANGKFAACTLKLCLEPVKRDPYAANFHCTPGSTFTNPADGCNTCTCNDEGRTAGCTEIDCNPVHVVSKRSPMMNDPASPDFSCTPGEVFKHADGCNTCTCADNGKVAACTLMLCMPVQEVLPAVVVDEPLFTGNPYQPEGFSCKPDSSFKYECNDCRCLPNGKLAMCTLKVCSEESARLTRGVTPVNAPTVAVNDNNPSAPNFRCKPGDQFDHADGCNSCICDKDGLNAACTLRQCLPADPTFNTQTVIPPVERKCIPGSRFMSDDGCNTCFCTNNGNIGCTLIYCGNKPAEPGKGGVAPNQSMSSPTNKPIQFPVDKRVKRDTDDLKSLPHFDTSVEGFTCEPGMRFRDRCNRCFCNKAGKAACTDKLCHDEEA